MQECTSLLRMKANGEQDRGFDKPGSYLTRPRVYKAFPYVPGFKI